MYGLFDEPCLPDNWPLLAEWGYEFMHNEQHIFPVCGNLTESAYSTAPVTREEALQRLQRYWNCRAADARLTANASSPQIPLISEIGHYLFAGDSMVFPQDFSVIPGSEIGENINSINLHIAATRGAAKTVGPISPFLLDFSSWLQGYILDYRYPNNHSVSLVHYDRNPMIALKNFGAPPVQ